MKPDQLVEKLTHQDDIEKAVMVRTYKTQSMFKQPATNTVSTTLTLVMVDGHAVEDVGKFKIDKGGEITEFVPHVHQPYWAIKLVQEVLADDAG